MSREFDQIIKKITEQNKELHNIDNQISKEVVKDINDLKKSIKNIETKIVLMEKVLNQLFELVNNITIFIDDAEDIADNLDDEDEEDWTPYDERNFSYRDEDDDDEYKSDDDWGIREDES